KAIWAVSACLVCPGNPGFLRNDRPSLVRLVSGALVAVSLPPCAVRLLAVSFEPWVLPRSSAAPCSMGVPRSPPHVPRTALRDDLSVGLNRDATSPGLPD